MHGESSAPAIALVERAKEELVAAIPSPRGIQAVELPLALVGFEESLRAASMEIADGMGGEAWEACRDAVAESLRRAERLRLEAPPLDYEGLVAAIGELLDPLEAFNEVFDAEVSRRRPKG